MKTTAEIGEMLARRRKSLGIKQKELAAATGTPGASLSRLENGHLPEFGVRKLMCLLTALGLELDVHPAGAGGGLDELRRELGGS
ncbi:helix-turn-helix domain-containing protein [bacterium]|jgi:transcriptional regulator with XRE-family HTH domain|nr:helix-turn-helix domain-containing protein [bacterium]